MQMHFLFQPTVKRKMLLLNISNGHWKNRDIQTNSVSLPVNKEISGDSEFLNEFADGAKHFNKQLALDALANSVTWRNTGTVAEINNNVIKPEIERLVLNRILQI